LGGWAVQETVALRERDPFRERKKRHHDHGYEIRRFDRKLDRFGGSGATG